MKGKASALVIGLVLLASSTAFAAPAGAAPEGASRALEFSDYHNHSRMKSFLYDMEAAYPGIAEVKELATTWEGREVLALKLSDDVGTDDASEPDVLYMGAHHGNELISAEVPLYLIDFLLSGYGKNGTVTRWLDTREIWFVPMVNPDGIESTLAGQSSRKNRRPVDTDGDGVIDGYGVDLNRNYDQNWGETGASHTVSDITYCGPEAFSENETRAVADLALDRNFVLSASFHSYGEIIFYPWGNDIDTAHPRLQTLEAISAEMGQRSGYLPMEGKDAYVTSGDSDDWLYANTDTLPFTVELATTYAPPADQIEDICRQNLDSSLYLLDIAGDPDAAQEADWTFMVYMAADNSLSAAAADDLAEMATAGSTADINIVALYDGASTGDSKLHLVQTGTDVSSPGLDDGGAVIDGSGEADMADPQTLANFVNWTLANYPAQKTALVIWNHGVDLLGGLCEDKGGLMETWELRGALAGNHFDIVGLDLCWQGNLELAYELRGIADHFVASETEEPEDGWDYEATLGFLTASPNTQPRMLAQRIVLDYLAAYPGVRYITMAAADMHLFETALIPALSELAAVLMDYSYYNYSEIKHARNETTILDSGKTHMADLCEFLGELKAAGVDAQVIEKADVILDMWDDIVFASGRGGDFPESGGLAIYFPFLAYDARYDTNFAFAEENWNEFLHELESPSQRPVIEHVALTDADNTQGPYTVNAAVMDDDPDASSVTLHYKIGSGQWAEAPMTGDGVNFSADIPGAANGTAVLYFITAGDLSGNNVSFPYSATKDPADYLAFTVLAKASVYFGNIDISPEENITEGDNVSISLTVVNDGPEDSVPATVSVMASNATGAEILIHEETVVVDGGGKETLLFNWTAAAGNFTLDFTLDIDGAANTKPGGQTVTLSVSEAAEGPGGEGPDGQPESGEDVTLLAMLILLLASVSSLSMVLLARVQVRRKRKENALRSIRRTAVLIKEMGDYGIDGSGSLEILESARKQVNLKNYNKALALAEQAREHADWKLKSGGSGGGVL